MRETFRWFRKLHNLTFLMNKLKYTFSVNAFDSTATRARSGIFVEHRQWSKISSFGTSAHVPETPGEITLHRDKRPVYQWINNEVLDGWDLTESSSHDSVHFDNCYLFCLYLVRTQNGFQNLDKSQNLTFSRLCKLLYPEKKISLLLFFFCAYFSYIVNRPTKFIYSMQIRPLFKLSIRPFCTIPFIFD